MSEAYDKGRMFEQSVAKILRSKLGARIKRDSRSGAGINRSDMNDYYNDIPLHLECKNHQTVNIKEWFRQADAAASSSKAPTVVFAMDEEVLCCLRFSDLVNFMVELADNRAEIDDLKQPVAIEQQADETIHAQIRPAVEQKIDRGYKTCPAGHLTDYYGKCLQKGCKYSRGYKPPKGKKVDKN